MLMKFKSTLLMLAVALAMPSMSQADVKVKTYGTPEFRTTTTKMTPTVKQVRPMTAIIKATPKADVPEGYAQITLTVLDADEAGAGVWGDGSGYQMLLDADATAYGSIIPETGGLTSSGDATAATYAEFEYKIPENADGAMATANMLVSGSLSAQIPAGTYDWCITNPTPGDRIWIASSNGNVGGRVDDYVFASGASYEFIVSLGGQNDQVDVTIIDPTAPGIPTELAVTPAATTAQVSWVGGANNETFNLRYRPYVDIDPLNMNRLWDFPLATYEDQLEGWSMYDADNDGNNWSLAYSSSAQDDVCFYSASYVSGTGALTPDNWLFTPEVKFGGTLTFKTWNQSGSYPDKIMVYYGPADFTSTDDFTAISEFITPGTTAETITIDLSNLTGSGVIAFRHYDCEDQWSIYIDDIAVTVPNPEEAPAWIEVNGVDLPYTIEGLTPETEYEVQVQGVAADGRVSDWTESVRFTTLAEGPQPEPKYYITGGFNNWNAEDPQEIGDAGVDITAVANPDDEFCLDFKLLTPGENDWIWIGGLNENADQGVTWFAITDDMLATGTEIDLYPGEEGWNFRLPEAGGYNISLVKEATPAGAKAPIDGVKMVVRKNTNVGINDVNAKAVKSVKYVNLAGMQSNVPFDGVNIVVTTYTDGTKAASKVIK